MHSVFRYWHALSIAALLIGIGLPRAIALAARFHPGRGCGLPHGKSCRAAKYYHTCGIRCFGRDHREPADGDANCLRPVDRRRILAIDTINECLRRDSDRGGP